MVTPPLSNMQARDFEGLLHPYTNLNRLAESGATIIARGKGVFVYDAAGKDYLEAMSGLWCTALGWGEEELAETAAEQMRKLSFAHIFGGKSHEPAIELAEKLKALMPFPVGKLFFANSGSEANDTQIKFAWFAANARGLPQKKKIIARRGGYHGVTLATASLTGLSANHDGFDLPLSFARHVSPAHYYRGAEPGESQTAYSARLAAELEDLILREGPDTIAAFIAEPVMGAGGAVPPPEGYFPAIAEVLARHDIAFIDDEVICGFGRTGNWFGCQTYGFTPDAMSLAKALSSAYVPISAVILSPELSDIVESEARRRGMLGHGYTYSAHPVAAAVALKTIELYERRGIIAHVRAMAPLFREKLRALGAHPLVGEADGVGLIGAVELVVDKASKRNFEAARQVGQACARFCEAEGLIVRPLLSDRIAVCPPLVINADEIGLLFERFQRGLDATLAWARAEGLF